MASMRVSKTLDLGSIPSTPAKYHQKTIKHGFYFLLIIKRCYTKRTKGALVMKKRYIVIWVVLLIIGGLVWLLLKSITPAKEEYIRYNSKVTQQIDQQLKEFKLADIRAKEGLIIGKTIDEIQASVKQGDLNYTQLTAFYLDRIRRFDTGAKGVNSVLEINPAAIAQAKLADASSVNRDGLHGIPVLVKDNINTKDMPTSAGAFALKDFRPAEDAPVVSNLLKNGAIVLGKANLSELANYMAMRMPSGYSSKGGQTHNPINPIVISPSGSSSGSAAAVAADLAPIALGTETTGSLVSPAAV